MTMLSFQRHDRDQKVQFCILLLRLSILEWSTNEINGKLRTVFDRMHMEHRGIEKNTFFLHTRQPVNCLEHAPKSF